MRLAMPGYFSTSSPMRKKVALTFFSFSTSRDRKSTRLNSSHLGISYAVFCLDIREDLNRNHRGSTHTIGADLDPQFLKVPVAKGRAQRGDAPGGGVSFVLGVAGFFFNLPGTPGIPPLSLPADPPI